MLDENTSSRRQTYETLSTPELELILYLYTDDLVTLEPSAVMEISQILAERNKQSGIQQKSPTESFADFTDRCQRTLGNEKETTSTPCFPSPSFDAQDHRCSRSGNERWRLARTLIAAMLALVIFAGLVPSALGLENLFTVIGNWSDSVFSFLREPSIAFYKEQDLDALEAIVEVICDIEGAVPKWLPDGFTMKTIDSSADPVCSSVIATYSDGNRSIYLLYSTIYDGTTINYEKDEAYVTLYTAGEQVHYVMTNQESPFCTWAFGHSECQIWGDLSEEELYQIIDSIYEEETQ